MTKQETAALFDRAANLIDEFGWAKGVYVDSAGCYCVSGALARAVCEHLGADYASVVRADQLLWGSLGNGLRPTWAECMGWMVNYLRDMSPHWCPGVASWNDCAAKSEEEVILVLRAAADDLRKVEA